MGVIKNIIAEINARDIVGGELDFTEIEKPISERLLDGLHGEKREIVEKLLEEYGVKAPCTISEKD